MAVIGIFAYQRGWNQTPYWIRQYIWCAVVLEVMMWLPLIALRFFLPSDFPMGQTFDFFAFIYLVIVFLDEILVWLGIAIAAVLLVGMLIPART